VSPFLSLPPPLQITALHVASHLPRLSPPTLRALAACALSPATPPHVALTLVDSLRSRADNSSCQQDPPAYLAFLRTILMGHSPPRDAPAKSLDSRHSAAPPDAAVRVLVEAAASALTTLRGPGPLDGFLLLHLVWPEPSPEQQQQQPPRATSTRAALGVLTAAAALLGGGGGGDGGAAAEAEGEKCESGAEGLPAGAHPRQMDARLAALAAEYAVAATTTVVVGDARGGTTVGMMMGSAGEAAAAAAARATQVEPVMTLLHARGSLLPPTLNALAAIAAAAGGPAAAIVAADMVRTQAFALRLLRERAAVDAVVEAAAAAAAAAAGDGAMVRAADELRSCRDHLFGATHGA